MSFILDALKKLEREKAVRSNAGVNISEGILRGERRGRRTGKRPVTLIVAVAALTLLVTGAGVAWLVLQRGSAVRQAAEVPGNGETRRATPAVSEQQRPPVSAKVPEEIELPRVAPVPQPSAAPRELPPLRSPARGPARTAAGAGPAEGPAEPNQIGGPPAGADLKVSGIAWQERRSARRAVVNGLLVPEGNQTGGFTVKEIFQNRVRFQGNGRTFDVTISGPALGEAPASPPPSRQAAAPVRMIREEGTNRARASRDDMGNFRGTAPGSAAE